VLAMRGEAHGARQGRDDGQAHSEQRQPHAPRPPLRRSAGAPGLAACDGWTWEPSGAADRCGQTALPYRPVPRYLRSLGRGIGSGFVAAVDNRMKATAVAAYALTERHRGYTRVLNRACLGSSLLWRAPLLARDAVAVR
jgi:hypothetical protein